MLIKYFLDGFQYLLFARFGGGGGGGSSGGNDNLWDTQAKKVNQDMAMSGELFDYWRKYAPGYLDNAQAMASDAATGALDARVRNKAEQEAIAANGKSTAAMNQNLAAYGINPNSGAFADMNLKQAIAGASNLTNAKNKAGEWAENQKWARNQDAYSMASGMQGNAVAMSNSAQSGLNGLSSMQNSQNSMDAANASGYGQFGSTLASAYYRRDGGLVRVQKYASGGAIRLANGGMPSSPVVGWRQRMAAMPTISQSDNSVNPLASVVGGIVPVVAVETARPYIKEAGTAIKNAMFNSGGEGAMSEGLGTGLSAAGESFGAGTSLGAGTTGATLGAETGTTTALGTTGAVGAETTGAALGTGLSAAGETFGASTALAGTEAVAAANAWNPVGWVLGGLALAGALSKADGGEIETLQPGGPVRGLGTETSDSIPAMLSDGEYVLNAGAVKMLGKSQLDKINKKGLKFRDDNREKGSKIPSVRLQVSKGR